MARTPNIDTDKLKAQGLQLRDAAAVHAGPLLSPQAYVHSLLPTALSPSFPTFTATSWTTTCLA